MEFLINQKRFRRSSLARFGSKIICCLPRFHLALRLNSKRDETISCAALRRGKSNRKWICQTSREDSLITWSQAHSLDSIAITFNNVDDSFPRTTGFVKRETNRNNVPGGVEMSPKVFHKLGCSREKFISCPSFESASTFMLASQTSRRRNKFRFKRFLCARRCRMCYESPNFIIIITSETSRSIKLSHWFVRTGLRFIWISPKPAFHMPNNCYELRSRQQTHPSASSFSSMISILFCLCFSPKFLANKNLSECFTAVCEILIVQRVLRGQETFLLFAWIKTFLSEWFTNGRSKRLKW